MSVVHQICTCHVRRAFLSRQPTTHVNTSIVKIEHFLYNHQQLTVRGTNTPAIMPPRLVRRETLSERIRTAINPLDQEMAFSTWLGGIDWDGFQNSLATPMGLFLNITYFIARANSDGAGRRRGAGDVLRRSTVDRMDGWGAAISYSVCVLSVGGDDMFSCRPLHNQFYDGDEGLLFYYFGTQLWFLSWALVVGSLVNTVYCFTKKRRYRLFENNIEVIPPATCIYTLADSFS